jgi:threonine/homoserine/homoserine lactone efflux protein
MESSLTLGSLAGLFAAMAVLAAVPSVSVLAVSARAASAGFSHGALTAAGVVAGDLLFILLAVFGLALLVEALGGLFFLVELLAGAYLIALGIAMVRPRAPARRGVEEAAASRRSSFMTGLLITLADQKAVLFYLGFLPAFVELSTLTPVDVVVVAAVAVLAVGGVKLAYACAAHRAGRLLGGRAAGGMNLLAACVLIGVGAFLLAAAWPGAAA